MKFNQAVDTSLSTFAVKRASVTANVSSIVWSADNKEAALTLATKLVAGTYTVTVTGLSDTAITGSVVAENEKVGAIEILSSDAVLATDHQDVTIGYLVSNQYGEDVTKTLGAGLTYTSGRGNEVALNGVLTVSDAVTDFEVGDTFALSILDSATGVFTSKQMVVAPEASVAAITIKGLYNADDETLDVNSTPADFMLLVDVTDQYGNAVPAASIAGGVITSVSDPTIYGLAGTFAEVTIDGAKQTVLKLANGSGADLKAGKATASIISKYNGARATYEVTVAEESKTDAITLSAPELAVAKEKVTIPFTVTDQYGNAVVKNSALTNSTVNVTASAGSIAWVPNYATGNASLVLDATGLATAQKVTITATTQEGKVALLTVDLQAPAVAEVITATEDVITNIAVGGTFELTYENLVVKDQYGRDFDLKDKLAAVPAANAGKYRVTVTDATPNTVLETLATTGTNGIDSNTATVTATGKAKGSTVLTLQLEQVNAGATAFVALTSSDLEVTATVSENSQFESYEVGTIAPIYDDNGAAYQRDVKVYGVKAGGTKVLLTSDLYSVTTNNAGLDYTAGKLVADGTVTTAPDFDDVTVKATFVIAGESGPVVIAKDVVVTKPALTIATAEWLTTANATIEDGVELITAANVVTLSKLIGTLTLEDQFGGAYALTGATVTITNIVPNGASTIAVTGNGTATAAITNPSAGDTFNMTIVIGGNSYTIPVVVLA